LLEPPPSQPLRLCQDLDSAYLTVTRIGSDWNIPPRFPVLPEGAVHVWLADLESWHPRLEQCCGILEFDEHERADRYREGEPRTRYQLTRGLLRWLLSGYLGTRAGEIAFIYNSYGKPQLAATEELQFNVSHTAGFSAFSFTRAGPIGVDIERVRSDMPRLNEIAQRYFAPGEYRALQELKPEERTCGFFRCWARKEATLKAKGDGIFGGLESFEVSVGHSPSFLRPPRESEAGGSWVLSDLPLVPGCTGAVAVLKYNRSDLAFDHWLATPGAIMDGKGSATNA
jgi:4'-phosphopantetheinyl transferase